MFGGTLRDSLWAGLLGLIIGFVTRRMDKLEANPFFSTIAAAFAMAVPAYLAAAFGLVDYVDAVIIGSLMILVPGLLITNSMRDIIYGDTNSGVNRIVQVLLSALAIAMGTAAAWHITSSLYGQTAASTLSYPFWLQAIAIAVACTGFVILFNVHGWGRCLCALGGVVTWMAYRCAASSVSVPTARTSSPPRSPPSMPRAWPAPASIRSPRIRSSPPYRCCPAPVFTTPCPSG